MSVRRWGEALLDADTERIRGTDALGLDEHLMWRRGRFRTKAWATSIVDVGRGQLRRQNRSSPHTVGRGVVHTLGRTDLSQRIGARSRPVLRQQRCSNRAPAEDTHRRRRPQHRLLIISGRLWRRQDDPH